MPMAAPAADAAIAEPASPAAVRSGDGCATVSTSRPKSRGKSGWSTVATPRASNPIVRPVRSEAAAVLNSRRMLASAPGSPALRAGSAIGFAVEGIERCLGQEGGRIATTESHQLVVRARFDGGSLLAPGQTAPGAGGG